MKIYSLVESAKANGIDPLKYLTYLLDNRPSADMPDDDFSSFIAPWSNETRKACEL